MASIKCRAAGRLGPPVVVGLLALQAAVVATFLIGEQSPVRAALAITYVLIAPGMAVVGVIGLDDGVTAWALGMAVSISLATTVAQGLVWAGAWSPGRGLALLVLITTPPLLAQLRPIPARAHAG